MAKKPSSTNDLFNEVFKTIEVVGVEETAKSLQRARYEALTLNDRNVEFILKLVSSQTKVPIERIIHGTDKTDSRKIAIALCVYYMKTELMYSYGTIKRVLKKDQAALSRYYSMIKKVDLTNPKGEFDVLLVQNFKQINILLTERKLNSYGKQ
jgi:hypothetical protein